VSLREVFVLVDFLDGSGDPPQRRSGDEGHSVFSLFVQILQLLGTALAWLRLRSFSVRVLMTWSSSPLT
jgi:hypothetical protein